jgi:2-dehydro-3-deoxygluconokinase
MSGGVEKGFRVVCLGEAMVELTPHQGRWNIYYGGDTLNVALHLTRLNFEVSYVTALGGDPFAGFMRAAWGREGLDVSLVLGVPELTTGLYCIDTDEQGERSFHYWRGQSAARSMFNAPGIDRAVVAAASADLLFFSLISLAILPDEGREAVLSLARKVRERGGKVAFDGNYRPRLWESQEEASVWRNRAAGVADFGLPSLDDEKRNGMPDDAAAILEHWRQCGCGEPVLKLGSAGVMLPDGSIKRPDLQLHPLDTSGAGDAFDAGYLAARLHGLEPAQAAEQGQRLASWVVMRRGAIPERDHSAPYAALAAELAGEGSSRGP